MSRGRAREAENEDRGLPLRFPPSKQPWVVLLRLVLVVATLGYLASLVLTTGAPGPGGEVQPNNSLLVLLSVAVYLIVAWFLRPRPDMSNLGHFGGLVDRPFDLSDDVNRFLLLMAAVLAPGRFVVHTLVDATALGLRLATGADQEKKQFEP